MKDRLNAVLESPLERIYGSAYFNSANERIYAETWLDRWERMFGVKPNPNMHKPKQFNYQGTNIQIDARRPASKKFRRVA